MSTLKSIPMLLSAFLLAMLANLVVAGQARAQLFCVWDPLGAGGDYYSMFKDYQLAAKRWGVQIDLKPFVDDAELDAAFRSGQCDMASMIGMRARQFNQFTGTLDAPSVLENYNQVREAMAIMASPKLSKYMVSDPYEVVGMVPVGAAYAVVHDRSINSLSRAAGKRVVVMDFDKTQPMLCDDFKAIPVPVPAAKMGEAFNKGEVDVYVAPMVLYKPMELYKGIGTSGGIVRRPMFELTMQLVARNGKFPPDFGQKSREYMFTQTDHALGIIHNQEADVESRMWIYAMHNELTEWNNTMRTTLEHMTKAGFFDRRMLTLLHRLRCKSDTDEPECAPTVQQQQEAVHP